MRKGVERADGDDEHDEGQNGGKAGRKHGNAVFLIHFHQLLIIHRLVVGVLLLQFLHFFLVFFHLDVLLAHSHPLINIEGKNNHSQNDGKHNNADAYNSYPLYEDTNELPQPVQGNIVRPSEKRNDGIACQ